MDIVRVEKISNEKWLNLYAARYEHNGHAGRWVFASRKPAPHAGNTSDAVLIVAVLHAADAPPRLVLEKEFRVPVGGYVYGFPAGLLEPGEGLEQTVRREVFGRTLHVAPAFDEGALADIRKWFESYYTIQFANYPVDPSYLSHGGTVVECAR